MKPISCIAALLVWVMVSSGSVSGQGQDVRHMVEIAKDVYTFTGGGSNSSFVVTSDGVVVFDVDIRNDDLPAIRKVTNKKVVYLFSSHASGDHSTGAWYLRADTPTFIATRNQLLSFPVEQKEFNQRKAEGVTVYKGAEIIPPTIGGLPGGIGYDSTYTGQGGQSGTTPAQGNTPGAAGVGK